MNVDDLMLHVGSVFETILPHEHLDCIPDAAKLPVDQYMTAVGQAARVATTVMAAASTAAKNNALLALARQIRQHAGS